MRIRSLTCTGKLRADRMLKPIVWQKLYLGFLPCSRTGTLANSGTLSNSGTLQSWHPLQFWHPPILATPSILAPFSFPAFLAGACIDQAWTKADAVLKSSFPVWLRFPLASPRARAPSDVYLAIGVSKNSQPGWQRIHLRLASTSWVKSRT